MMSSPLFYRRWRGLPALALVLCIAVWPSGRAMAQQRVTTRSSMVHWSKWVMLAAAVGFGAYALHENRQADRAYDRLNTLCHSTPASCAITNGHYADAGAERIIGDVQSSDRHAQAGIIGGQLALVGSAALFIIDLHHVQRPPDIPYTGVAAAARSPAIGVGLSVGF
jgi:hypothetical protein